MAAWIGLMSGTSMDGIDAVLVNFTGGVVQIICSHTEIYPDPIRHRLLAASQNQATPDEIGELDTLVGELFATAANTVLSQSSYDPKQVRGIGSHGQTLRHQPLGSAPFSLQIGNPARIAEATGLTTIADFRRRDMAAGGQGAPLAPAFHNAMFSSAQEDRYILNLGGIANLTWLPARPELPVTGFDTGPANALMDAWCLDQIGHPFDTDGRWAGEGTINQTLLEDMLSDAYFSKPAPKSTGKERYNLGWIKTVLSRHPQIPAQDIQRTLLQLTVDSIVRQLPKTGNLRLFVCGGGTRNPVLMAEFATAIPHASVSLTSELGVDPQLVEPMAFAWLAKQAIEGRPGNLPEVTGASGPRILGAIYPA